MSGRGRFILAVLVLGASMARAETVSRVSIGCDTPEATLMAEQALQDKLSGRDHNAMDRIGAYQKQAGRDACRPLNQGDAVEVLRAQDDLVCVREQDQRLRAADAPACYWMRKRYIKLPQ